MGVLAIELSGLNSRFQGLKFVSWLGTAPMKMVKEENDMDRTLNIDCAGVKGDESESLRVHSGVR